MAMAFEMKNKAFENSTESCTALLLSYHNSDKCYIQSPE